MYTKREVVIRMKTTVYTTTTCPYCKTLKSYLDENNISYEEKRVDTDEKAREQIAKESGGFMGVPFTVIEKDSGEKENIVGFDKEKIKNVFGL
jgi:glutaredoxin